MCDIRGVQAALDAVSRKMDICLWVSMVQLLSRQRILKERFKGEQRDFTDVSSEIVIKEEYRFF